MRQFYGRALVVGGPFFLMLLLLGTSVADIGSLLLLWNKPRSYDKVKESSGPNVLWNKSWSWYITDKAS